MSKKPKELRIEFGKRLEIFMTSTNITRDELAIHVDFTRQTIGNIIQGKNPASSDLLTALSNVFPELNINWLLTGRGTMINSEQDLNVDKRTEYSKESLIDLMNNKDATIMAQQKNIRKMEELIEAQKGVIVLLEEKLSTFSPKD